MNITTVNQTASRPALTLSAVQIAGISVDVFCHSNRNGKCSSVC